MISKITIILLLISVTFCAQEDKKKESATMGSSDTISDIIVKDAEGKDVAFSDYSGKVLLIVNVASKCGYTPQYEGLQKIYEKYNLEGFEILGFPCNDFGGQESGSMEEIKNFCSVNYGVSFKLFSKVKILGDDKSPLYERLTSNPVTGESDVKWNFEKFLISREGKIVKRFRSGVEPESEELISAIENEMLKQ